MPAPKGEKGVQGITGRQGFPGDRVRVTAYDSPLNVQTIFKLQVYMCRPDFFLKVRKAQRYRTIVTREQNS